MSKIKELLKKTPLLAAVRKYRRAKRDKFLFRDVPAAYRKHSKDPVDPNKVLFIELRYDHLTDSLQGLYQEMKKRGFDIHVHAVNHSSIDTKEYRKRSLAYAEDMATAHYVLISDANEVISALPKRPETIVTQVWHACGAFKRFGMSTADLGFGYDREQQLRHPSYKNLDYVAVSSPDIIWAYAEAMSLQDRQEIIRPVGTARTDVFFDSDFISGAYDRVYAKFPAARGKKIILFAPTFRGRIKEATTSEAFELEKFRRALGDDYVVIMKHHPLVKKIPEIPSELQGTFAYDATHDMTIEDLLCVSDICISDYSSLIFEYSLFERPMIFFAYDLDDYYDFRGFYYPYEELTPGPVCKTNEEMLDYILHIEERFDRQQVKDFRDKFMRSCDGHATERIVDMITGQNTNATEQMQ